MNVDFWISVTLYLDWQYIVKTLNLIIEMTD